jgi:2-keto-4-pentenoate hydratase/2-oxohepta-3-ene-1,7-dioic acid hydratase in catechol pathway
MQRFVRVEKEDGRHYGELIGNRVLLFSAAPWAGGTPLSEFVALDQVRLLCPVVPSKIIGIGRNYREHASEMGGEVPKQPLIFLKAPSALNDPGASVQLPAVSERVDFEGELAVVIGRRARRVSSAEALTYVFGYAVACDITARDLQKSDGQWSRAKGFDSFCPLSSAVTVGVNPNDLELTTTVNGERRQHGRTSSMVFSVAELVAYVSTAMTLEAGDVILTGTPEGVGPMQPGDRVKVEIGSLGQLEFETEAEPV